MVAQYELEQKKSTLRNDKSYKKYSCILIDLVINDFLELSLQFLVFEAEAYNVERIGLSLILFLRVLMGLIFVLFHNLSRLIIFRNSINN